MNDKSKNNKSNVATKNKKNKSSSLKKSLKDMATAFITSSVACGHHRWFK